MSPPDTSTQVDYLEHPEDAIRFYHEQEVTELVAEVKHMGSRAIIILCRDEDAAWQYFKHKGLGTIYTRSGKQFFDEPLQAKLLQRLRGDLRPWMSERDLDYLIVDAEVLPWNAKSGELIRQVYENTGLCAERLREALSEALRRLEPSRPVVKQEHKRSLECGTVADLLSELAVLQENTQRFNTLWQRYCWEIQELQGLQIAPFHYLADSAGNYFDKTHAWHMVRCQELAGLSALLMPTEWWPVSAAEQSWHSVIEAWLNLEQAGLEGLVFKPSEFICQRNGQLVQPALKCRTREYLRIIYGMDYTLPHVMSALKSERKTYRKRQNALWEFALGVEALRRFQRGEPLEQYHECILGVLALESEPLDPRL